MTVSSPILLVALNARFIHASFGLRYLLANMGPLRDQTGLLELTLGVNAADVVEEILARDPQIVGLGVYIWNAALSAEVVALLTRLRPRSPSSSVAPRSATSGAASKSSPTPTTPSPERPTWPSASSARSSSRARRRRAASSTPRLQTSTR